MDRVIEMVDRVIKMTEMVGMIIEMAEMVDRVIRMVEMVDSIIEQRQEAGTWSLINIPVSVGLIIPGSVPTWGGEGEGEGKCSNTGYIYNL